MVLESLFHGDFAALDAAIEQKQADYRRLVGQELSGLDAEKEIIADFARTHLNEKEVVQRFMDAGFGGKMRNTLHNINQALKNFSGDDYTTLDGQLRYLQHELKTNEAKAWAHMQNIPNTAEGAYTAAWNWAQYFERCSSSHYASRGSSAQQKYWPKYHGAAVPTPAPTAKPSD